MLSLHRNKFLTILFFSFQLLCFSQSDSQFHNNYFVDKDVDYVYKTSIALKKNKFSGILYIKRINADTVRLAFSSEMGNVIFDLTISKKGYTVNRCLKKLDHKVFLKQIVEVFKVMTLPVLSTIDKSHSTLIGNKRADYIFNDQLDAIKLYKNKRKTKFIIRFQNLNYKINVDNHSSQFYIEMNRID